MWVAASMTVDSTVAASVAAVDSTAAEEEVTDKSHIL
jgi:hypothetical protein